MKLRRQTNPFPSNVPQDIRFFNSPTHNDRWVVDLYHGKKSGYFVEAGALDGISGSCTYTLELYYQWTGILVEPGAPFGALAKNRPGSICENLCLADHNGPVRFVQASQAGYSGIKEKLLQKDLLHQQRWGTSKTEWQDGQPVEKEIAAVRFYDLLTSHHAPRIIHYVAFDMEGSEYSVLENFPFDQFKILAFSIEGDTCSELLNANGYRQVGNPFNTEAPWEHYYLHKDFDLLRNS